MKSFLRWQLMIIVIECIPRNPPQSKCTLNSNYARTSTIPNDPRSATTPPRITNRPPGMLLRLACRVSRWIRNSRCPRRAISAKKDGGRFPHQTTSTTNTTHSFMCRQCHTSGHRITRSGKRPAERPIPHRPPSRRSSSPS
jgi:hypothetical protein